MTRPHGRTRAILILPSLVWLVALPTVARAGSVSVDFNGGTELATLFTVNDFSAAGSTSHLTQVADGGIVNSGAVDIDAVDFPAAATYHVSAFDFTTGAPLSAGISFQYQNFTLPLNHSRDIIELGFVTERDGTFTLSDDDMSVQVTAGTTGDITLFTSFGRHAIGLGRSFSLAPGNWYRLEGTFVNLGAALGISASLDDYGPTGEGPGSNLVSIFFTSAPDGNILTDSAVWVGFEANSEGGANLVDNLSAAGPGAGVPEPSPRILFVFAILAVACWRSPRPGGFRGRTAAERASKP